MLTPGAAAAGAALILSSAQTARADFSGPYAPGNWVWITQPGSGATFTNDGTTLVITSSDNGSGSSDLYLINLVASGTLSFDWTYTSADSGDYDWGGYSYGNTVILAYNSNAPTGGSVSLGVIGGQDFAFQIFSADGTFGPGVLTITNFVAPVPAPGALALLGLAAISGRSRRRRC
jgi:MYXO-CTERM domain-containing protein